MEREAEGSLRAAQTRARRETAKAWETCQKSVGESVGSVGKRISSRRECRPFPYTRRMESGSKGAPGLDVAQQTQGCPGVLRAPAWNRVPPRACRVSRKLYCRSTHAEQRLRPHGNCRAAPLLHLTSGPSLQACAQPGCPVSDAALRDADVLLEHSAFRYEAREVGKAECFLTAALTGATTNISWELRTHQKSGSEAV